VSYSSSILCDVEYDLFLCEGVVVFHVSRCDLTMVRFGDVLCSKIGMVKMVKTVRVCGCSNLLRTES
jgi:hypothetical protein